MPQFMARLGALFGLVVLAVPLATIAAIVRIDSPGPVFYRAMRVGRNGRPFAMVKFRTMRNDASGARLTVAKDPRITRAGEWLRRYRLDEIPQLWNVLTGTMAPVGPRPEDPAYVDLTDPTQQVVLSVLPGVTGPSQLAFRNESETLGGGDVEAAYRTYILPLKLAIDSRYVESRSLKGDLRYVRATLRAVFTRRDH